MSYRPDHAGFELNAGSAVSAVLPASGLAAAIGSTCAFAGVFFGELSSSLDFTADSLLGLLFGFLVFVGLGTIVGTFFCAFYIALVGMPIAALLGPRIETPAAAVISVLAAIATSYVAASLLAGDFEHWEPRDKWGLIGFALAYAIPAGLLYRKAVISARHFSRWS
ncbi:hypothetical protein [Erythrobacter sp. F6033]|uniref:hypothetical protein n=1 Tax=Erythrobacter sp. F6033 TaxID=2926401 RepID=UPI001FF49017|nr:hypothetical protein [Erythrobacter sp. F6033]MCK0127292.1 hypothetical protein [Erythrobacter sp. F6033]